MCLHGLLVQDYGTGTLRCDEQPTVGQTDDAGHGSLADELVYLALGADLSVVVDAQAMFASYPYAAVGVFEESVDVGSTVTDIDGLEGVGADIEAHHAFVFHAQPDVALAVGHQAAGERMETVAHVVDAPLALQTPRRPQTELVFTAHPQPACTIVSNGVGSFQAVELVEVRQPMEKRLPAADEIESRAVASYPDVAVVVAENAARIVRRKDETWLAAEVEPPLTQHVVDLLEAECADAANVHGHP